MKRILKNVANIILRTADNLLLGGIFSNKNESTQIISKTKGVLDEFKRGQIDFKKLVAGLIASIPFWLMLGLFFHIVTLNQIKQFLELIK